MLCGPETVDETSTVESPQIILLFRGLSQLVLYYIPRVKETKK